MGTMGHLATHEWGGLYKSGTLGQSWSGICLIGGEVISRRLLWFDFGTLILFVLGGLKDLF